MSDDSERASSRPDFWDKRYANQDHLFGEGPSAFVVQEAHRLSSGSTVVELGAGEGRTLVWLCRERNCRTTAVDFSTEALTQAATWAREEGLSLNVIEADLRTWTPSRRWDTAIVTFVQLLPDERPALYRCLRRAVRPGGWILAEWFRPAHVETDRYARIGPSRADRMVPIREVREAFSDDRVVRCDSVDTMIEEGPLLNGRAALVRLVAQRAAE